MILTSTSSKGISKKGIQIGEKIVSFGDKRIFQSSPTKKLINSHDYLKATFKDQEGLHNFMNNHELKMNIWSEGSDTGEWSSQISYELDYEDDFFLFMLDDLFFTAGEPNEYYAFLKK